MALPKKEDVVAPSYPTPQDTACTHCAATTSLNANYSTLRYIEQEKPLIEEHLSFYHKLRQFVDDVLCRKTPWTLTKLSPKLLCIIDHNYKHHGKVSATDDMYHYLQHYASSSTLIACSMGSNWNLELAQQCVLDIVQWRVMSRIDEISPPKFENSLQTKSVFHLNEFDRSGHPICHFRVLQTPPDDAWTIVRAAVFSMEKAIKSAQRKGVYQMLWMVDLSNLAYSTIPPMEIVTQIANLWTYYYPERLYRAYLIFTPWVFATIFAMVKPILPERTQHKLVNPGWYECESYDTFKHDIDRSQLMQRCGGDRQQEYEFAWELQQYELHANEQEKKKAVEKKEKKEEKVEMEMDEEQVDDSKLCIVCMEHEKDHVIIPCGHLCLCSECKQEHYTENDDVSCPMCQGQIEKIIKTYQ